MKKLLLFILFISAAMGANAQNTIKFLGIPVDGTKREMISKLEAKGYEYNSYRDYLTRDFNGQDVMIQVQTVNNIVWRIAVADDSGVNETNIKIRFNNLFDQFSNNGKYICVQGDKLSDNDDISYEMSVHNKRYDACFKPKDTSINGCVWYTICEPGGEYAIFIFYENTDNAANGDDLQNISLVLHYKSDCHLAVAFLRLKALAKQSFATPFRFTNPPKC